MKYAKIKSRNTVKGKRFSYEYKEIIPGGQVRWPYHAGGFWLSADEAKRAVELNGGLVVKTWDEAIAHAGLYSSDGFYHTQTGPCPCASKWCER